MDEILAQTMPNLKIIEIKIKIKSTTSCVI